MFSLRPFPMPGSKLAFSMPALLLTTSRMVNGPRPPPFPFRGRPGAQRETLRPFKSLRKFPIPPWGMGDSEAAGDKTHAGSATTLASDNDAYAPDHAAGAKRRGANHFGTISLISTSASDGDPSDCARFSELISISHCSACGAVPALCQEAIDATTEWGLHGLRARPQSRR